MEFVFLVEHLVIRSSPFRTEKPTNLTEDSWVGLNCNYFEWSLVFIKLPNQ